MKNNDNKFVKIYGILGKVLCGCAGGIVGFLLGGPLMSVPGVVIGIIAGRFLEKSFINASS